MRLSLVFLPTLLITSAVAQTCLLEKEYQDIIDSALAPFRDGIKREDVSSAMQRGQTCWVSIRNKKMNHSPCLYATISKFLRSIQGELPDMDFVVTNADFPQVQKNFCKAKTPFRQCACDPNYQIPNHGLLQSHSTTSKGIPNKKIPVFGSSTISECFIDLLLPSEYHIKQSFQKNPIPWEEKELKAFWRGSTTGLFCGDYNNFSACLKNHRQRLVTKCKDNPMCDAGFTAYVQCSGQRCSQLEEAFPKANYVSGRELGRYKILIDIDGNTYSGRFPTLLSYNSVVLKIAAFEDLATKITRPWLDYIPVRMDLSDLEEKLEWVRDNDVMARMIADTGRERIRSLFSLQSLRCYTIRLLLAYHKLLI